MAAYRKIPATGDVELDRVNQAVYEALLAIAPPTAFEAVTVSKDYAARGDEGVIHVDSSAGPVRVTLPRPSTSLPPLLVKQVNFSKSPRATFGPVTVVAADAAKTIAGASSYALDTSGTGSVTFTSDGQQHWPGSSAGGNPPVNPAPPAPPPFVPPVPPVPPAPPPVVLPNLPGTFSYGNDSLDDATGTEVISLSLQRAINLDPYGGSIVFTLTGNASSQSGTALFNVRVGGTDGGVDGAIVATLTATSPTVGIDTSVPVFFANPRGKQFVKITVQSSSAGQNAHMDSMTLSFQ